MPLFTRQTLPGLFGKPEELNAQVYLLVGDRYLCRSAAEQLEAALLAEGGTVHPIDGDQEDINATIARLRSFSLLPGRQVFRVTDTRLFHSRQVARGLWERAGKAHTEGRTDQAGRLLRALLQAGGLEAHGPDSDLPTLAAAEWQQCFGFARPDGDLGWTRAYLQAGAPGGGPAAGASIDPADALAAALAAGLPRQNVLVLLAEEADRRKRLFKLLKDEQAVIDLSVETGAGARAQKEQRGVLQELARTTLAEQDKTLAANLAELLFERVGFHPVALVMELRKVMLFVGERRQITREDLDQVIGRTRQEALFELTAAIGRRDLEQALAIGDRLQENGIHPLAVVATLRQHVRGQLLCRALAEQPDLQFRPTMSAAAFQQECLPLLKSRAPWQKEMGGHPYALFMQFKTAAAAPLSLLARWMRLLLEAELRLKGSPVAPALVLQHLLVAMLTAAPATAGK